jgi:hypothetical protein
VDRARPLGPAQRQSALSPLTVKRSSNRAAYPSSGPGAGGHATGLDTPPAWSPVITGSRTHRQTLP